MNKKRKLRKLSIGHEKKWIGGVCGGVAYWLGVPIWIVRLIWAALIIGYGLGFGLYILCWIFMPRWQETPNDLLEVTGD